jgi:hypothetical protein
MRVGPLTLKTSIAPQIGRERMQIVVNLFARVDMHHLK